MKQLGLDTGRSATPIVPVMLARRRWPRRSPVACSRKACSPWRWASHGTEGTGTHPGDEYGGAQPRGPGYRAGGLRERGEGIARYLTPRPGCAMMARDIGSYSGEAGDGSQNSSDWVAAVGAESAGSGGVIRLHKGKARADLQLAGLNAHRAFWPARGHAWGVAVACGCGGHLDPTGASDRDAALVSPRRRCRRPG